MESAGILLCAYPQQHNNYITRIYIMSTRILQLIAAIPVLWPKSRTPGRNPYPGVKQPPAYFKYPAGGRFYQTFMKLSIGGKGVRRSAI